MINFCEIEFEVYKWSHFKIKL